MHDITPDCPLECLTPLLPLSTAAALAAGLQSSPGTVAQVIELYQQGRLKDIRNISTGRNGPIKWCLTQTGLIPPDDSPMLIRRVRANGLRLNRKSSLVE